MERPKVVVIMPAYNAAKTLKMTYMELPHDMVDLVLLVNDGSSDETVEVARQLNLDIFLHNRNYGYGGNQKTCYLEALREGADIVVRYVLHKKEIIPQKKFESLRRRYIRLEKVSTELES